MTDEAKQIAPSVLLALAKQAQGVRSANSQRTKELSDRISHHIENSNLQRAAFAAITKMDRMDEQDRADFWDALNLYYDVFAKNKWAGESHVGDLADMAGEDKEEADPAASVPAREAEEAKATAENTKRLRRGVKKLAETAGASMSPPAAPPAPAGDAPGTYKLQ